MSRRAARSGAGLDNEHMFARWTAVVGAAVVCGCAPTLDWREFRPDDTGLVVLLPCKPKAQQRDVSIDARELRLTLHSCRVTTMSFGVAHVDVVDPARVATALDSMRAAWVATPLATASGTATLQVRGMTPQPGALRVRLRIARQDQPPASAVAAFFAKGTRVFQVTAYGTPLDDEAVETFLSSLVFAELPR